MLQFFHCHKVTYNISEPKTNKLLPNLNIKIKSLFSCFKKMIKMQCNKKSWVFRKEGKMIFKFNVTCQRYQLYRKRLNWAFVIFSTDLLMFLFICKCYHFSTSNRKMHNLDTLLLMHLDTASIETCNAEGYRQVLLKSG